MIIEGLVTCQAVTSPSSLTAQGEFPHVAALGPVVSPDLTQWLLRPYQTSRIFQTLRANSTCVFHVIDDVLPIVQLVLGLEPDLTYRRLSQHAWLVEQACHWYQLEILHWNLDNVRSEATARVVDQGDLRPFWGWNRGKHALLEAAILISRASMMPADELTAQLDRLQSPIEKTAGPRELAAWQIIQQWRARFSESQADKHA